jgi:hypothetical protein
VSGELHSPEHVLEILRAIGAQTNLRSQDSVEAMTTYMLRQLEDYSRRQLRAVLHTMGLDAPRWASRRDLVAILTLGWVRQELSRRQ